MTVEEKSDRWFKEKYGNEGFTDIEEEIRKICFEDGYKECEKEQKECQDFIWESVGFKKRGFVNSIQIAEYIGKLEKEREETRKKVIEIFANDEAQQGELWKACGLRLVGWDYEKNQLDENFMLLYGVIN